MPKKRARWRLIDLPKMAASAIAVGMALCFGNLQSVSAQDAASSFEHQELVGTVVLQEEGLPGIDVTLHRVSSNTAGEVARDVTDSQGRFRFPLEPDSDATFTVYFVTADYLSARYFGDPIHPEEPLDDYIVAVYDTTSVLNQPIRVVSRDIVMIPEQTGSWEVNEVVRIVNPGSAALVAETGAPTWQFRIPDAASAFEVGEGDLLPHEVTRMEDRVLVLTPITPGERDLFIRYRLPAEPNRADFPVDNPTEALNVFVLQPSHLTSVEGLESTRRVDADGQEFLQYAATDLSPDRTVQLQWSTRGTAPVDPVVASVAVTVALLAVGLWAALRNRPSTSA